MDATTFRTCAHTGLRVHLTAERLIKAHAVAGVLAILFGGIAALGVLLTRWPAVHLLEPAMYYRALPFHGAPAAIIAVVTLAHGAIIYIPTWLWSLGVIQNLDAGMYRLVWWGLGHSSQQINVAAMVAVWYLLATLTVGAVPINEKVCRSAFLLYILFINLASAHHLLVDPQLSPAWKIWNTSYGMYLAVLASMIHGMTVPASIEVAQRKKGLTKGLFEWG